MSLDYRLGLAASSARRAVWRGGGEEVDDRLATQGQRPVRQTPANARPIIVGYQLLEIKYRCAPRLHCLQATLPPTATS